MSDPSAPLDAVPTTSAASALPFGRLVARRLSSSRRRATDEALASGAMREIAREELLDENRLPDLARQSLWLLGAGGMAFGAVEAASWAGRPRRSLPGRTRVGRRAGLIAGNLLGYALMLPLHEAAHAGAMLALGGRPRFGARFPLALYCAAPEQVFTRDGYTFVLLAPLVSLSALGAVLTWLSPIAGAYLLFALAGNISGCVADIAAARSVRRLPPDALIADTADGYIAYLIADGR